MRRVNALALVLAIGLPGWHGITAAQDTTSRPATEFQRLVAELSTLTNQQDSLEALAESATGDLRKVRTEQIWERQSMIDAALLAAAEHLRRQESAGADLSESRRVLDEMVQRGWPRYQGMLRDVQDEFERLRRERDAVSGAQRVAIESHMSDLSDRQSAHYHALVDAMLALERVGVDVSVPRQFVISRLTALADVLVTRLRVIDRERASTAAQVARAPSEQSLRHELFAIDERNKRETENLALAIELLDRFKVDTTRFKVALITTTGRISADAFNPRVIGGLLEYARKRALDVLATQAPRWLFRALIIVLVLAGFRVLAGLTRSAVRRAVSRTQMSYLLRETLTAGSKHVVMGIGVIVILAQLGVQVGALVAGLGIAGFVVGFAMQNTLSNFAAGAMILAYRPFDLGDDIEAGGASGKVKAMSLVATTILTGDNQTLVVPNSKIWGDVIRNTTAQATRRVDLIFGVGYLDDLDKAERVLHEILAANPKVLKDPPPVVKLHQLADGALNFIVRPWARGEHYWDVHWEITRAVKLRFDQEGISIPAARRDLYLHTVPGKPST